MSHRYLATWPRFLVQGLVLQGQGHGLQDQGQKVPYIPAFYSQEYTVVNEDANYGNYRRDATPFCQFIEKHDVHNILYCH